jgi:hypothetical protein
MTTTTMTLAIRSQTVRSMMARSGRHRSCVAVAAAAAAAGASIRRLY